MKKLLKTFATITFISLLFSNFTIAQSIDQGIRHLEAERYLAAQKVFEGLASSTPSTENYFELGRYYLSTPNYKENISKSVDAFTKGNALGKKGDTFNTIGLGMAKLATKDFSGAKLIFDEVIKDTKSKDPDALYRIAEAYTMFEDANDPGEAVLLIDQALEKQKVKDNPNYYIVKAIAFIIKNEGGDAMNALQNAERVGGKHLASIYSTMAKVWLQGKNYKEAQDAINKSISADIEHAPAYKYQSSYYQTYQKWDLAAEAAANYLKYSDGDESAKLRYTKLAFIAKDWDNVKKTIREIEGTNTDPIVLRLEGIAEFEQGNAEKAIPLLNKFIQTAPKDEILGLDYGFLSRAHLALNDDQNDALAMKYVDQAIALQDTTFDYYTEFGEVFKERKKYDLAEQYLAKAIDSKKNPTGEDFFRLGILQYQLKQWDKADESFDKVCKSYGDTWAPPYLLSARIKVYRDREDTTFIAAPRYEKYLSLIGEEVKSNPANKRDISESLGYLAQKALAIDKDLPKANLLLDELLKYDPENENAINMKNEINGIVPETQSTVDPK